MTDTNDRIALDHQFITPSPTPRFEVVRLIGQLSRTELCLTFTLSLGKLAGSHIRDTSHTEFIFRLLFNNLRHFWGPWYSSISGDDLWAAHVKSSGWMKDRDISKGWKLKVTTEEPATGLSHLGIRTINRRFVAAISALWALKADGVPDLVLEKLEACPCSTDQPIRRSVNALPPFRRLLYLFIVHLNLLSSSALLTSIISFAPTQESPRRFQTFMSVERKESAYKPHAFPVSHCLKSSGRLRWISCVT